MRDVSALIDEPVGPYKSSPRLAAVLSQLPKHSRARVTNALYNAGVYTLTDLRAKKGSDLLRYCKNFGKKALSALEQTLAAFDLVLADPTVRRAETLIQTPAQRITNPVWLRGELQELIKSCDVAIEKDRKLSEAVWRTGDHQRYSGCIASHRHWKRQLERILQGKTHTEIVRSGQAEEDLS